MLTYRHVNALNDSLQMSVSEHLTQLVASLSSFAPAPQVAITPQVAIAPHVAIASKEKKVVHPEDEVKLPGWMRPIFAITIRETRFQALLDRLGPVWQTNVLRWNGTVGQQINRHQCIVQNTIRPYCRLTNGQLGCYDSHVRLWQECVQTGRQMFIVEDDANLDHKNVVAMDTCDLLWQRLQDAKIDFDFLYIGHNNKHKPLKYMTNFPFGPNVVVPRGVQGLFAYVIRPSGAKFLLEHAMPYDKPVDVYVTHELELNKDQTFKCFAMYPSPFYVVDVKSDTI